MKIKITISGSGGELDSETVEIPEGAQGCPESQLIKDVIDGWTLSVGDTITITEVQS